MAKILTDSKYYQDIAAAIRAKESSETLYKPSEMAPKIIELFNETGGSSSETQPIVEIATPEISVSNTGLITATTTQSAGTVPEGTKSATKQLTTDKGGTYTENQTLYTRGKYMTGNIVIDVPFSSYYTGNGMPVPSIGKVGDFYYDLGEEG